MRRLKTCRQVIANLPDKMESVSFCPLGKKQIARYQKTVDNLASLAEAAPPAKNESRRPGQRCPAGGRAGKAFGLQKSGTPQGPGNHGSA